MNERIRELAIDCATQLDWDLPSDPTNYTFSSTGLEKFAELIVRECCSIGEQYADGLFDLKHYAFVGEAARPDLGWKTQYGRSRDKG